MIQEGFAENLDTGITKLTKLIDTICPEYFSFFNIDSNFPASIIRCIIHSKTELSDLEEWEKYRIYDRIAVPYKITDKAGYSYISSEHVFADGNTLKVTRGSQINSEQLNHNRETSVIFYTPDEVVDEQYDELIDALNEFLLELIPDEIKFDAPIRGSLYQKIKLSLRFGDYTNTLISNLQTAFGLTVTHGRIDASIKLSQALEKHDNIVIKADNVIAVKRTINGKSYVVIQEIPKRLKSQIDRNPEILSNVDKVYQILTTDEAGPDDRQKFKVV